MKLYCVKQKRQTENKPNTERYVHTKNGRLLLQAECSECGILKSTFVSERRSKGRGVGQKINKSISKEIPGFSESQSVASALMAITGGDKDLFKKYWDGQFLKGMVNKDTGITTKKFWTRLKKGCTMELRKGKDGKWHNTYGDDC